MLTVTEVATQLGLSARTVAYRLERGTMQGVKVNPRLWLVPRDEVDRWRGKGRLKPGRPRKDPSLQDAARENVEHQDALEETRRRIRGETD